MSLRIKKMFFHKALKGQQVSEYCWRFLISQEVRASLWVVWCLSRTLGCRLHHQTEQGRSIWRGSRYMYYTHRCLSWQPVALLFLASKSFCRSLLRSTWSPTLRPLVAFDFSCQDAGLACHCIVKSYRTWAVIKNNLVVWVVYGKFMPTIVYRIPIFGRDDWIPILGNAYERTHSAGCWSGWSHRATVTLALWHAVWRRWKPG